MNEKDFEIDVYATDEAKQKGFQLPINFITVGEIEVDDVKVYIKQNVYKELEKFASSDKTKELGTILLGSFSEELGKTHVLISDHIEAKHTDASASTLTFTHETWDYVHKEHQRIAPNLKIIGWQHTHPNYGIFLSNYDIFIQENFFNMPFQIAYVIDPVQNIRGFFQWKNDKIEKLKGYYIYDDVGKTIKINQAKSEKGKALSQKTSKPAIIIATILLLLNIIFCVSLVSSSRKYEALEKENKELSENVETIEDEKDAIIDAKDDEIFELNQLIVDSVNDQGEIPVVDIYNFLKESDISDESYNFIASTIGSYEASVDIDTDTNINLLVYTVEEGDSIYSICEENDLDFVAASQLIFALNGLDDDGSIYIGQNILIPNI